jgi:hypothetical protein
MPNTLDAIIPRILAAGSVALRENAVMAMLVRTDFQGDAAQKGQTVDVPIPSSMGVATDVIPSPNLTGGTDLAPTSVPIVLNKWKESAFTITDAEAGRIMNGYIPLQITEAARALANAIDSDLLALYRNVWGVAGLAGTTPFQNGAGIVNPGVQYDLGASRDTRKILNRQLAPIGDRRIVLDVDAEANAGAIAAFASALNSADSQVITNGVIGRKQGFDWYMDQSVQRHTTGATGIYLNSVAALAGATTITVFNGAGVPAVGDVFFIAGQVQPYVLRAGSTTTSWNISPPLRAPIAANTTFTQVTSHVANLGFHRDAFGLAIRSLNDVLAPGSVIQTFVDNVSGIPLRLEFTRQNKQTKFSFDVLYGTACIRPELACRLLG